MEYPGRAIEAIAVGKEFHVFCTGNDGAMYHKYWDGNAWDPSGTDWDPLGGAFAGPPAAAMANDVAQSRSMS